ncbi:MAG: hypothetical protein H5U07_00355 [Candidatus Aminicenantes bacterium]|nr:hypothetical protein [Candidatus Aminicenantes bacterium]
MVKKYKIVTLSFFLLAFLTSQALAIPAFARRYSMSCKVCHAPFPKLKAYGEEFAGNGFVIKDKETPRYTIDTGDGLLSLLRELPVAIRFEGYFSFNNADNKSLDFSSPFLIKLLSGGEIAKNISYYFYFFFSERGEVAGLEDAFIMLNNLFKTDLDVYLGQFQVSDPLFKREVRLTYEDYRIYKVRVGQARANLTYDRGIMLTYGLPTGTDLTFEVVNGLGLLPADRVGSFDTDKYKNFMLRISQDVLNNLRVGAFGYTGKEKQGEAINTLWMMGADFTWTSPKLELNVQYVERRDDNPFFWVLTPEKVQTRGGFAEIIYMPEADDSRWYTTALFNWVDSDQTELRYSSFGLHFGYLLRRNMRATVEGTYVFKSEQGAHFRLGLGIITAF